MKYQVIPENSLELLCFQHSQNNKSGLYINHNHLPLKFKNYDVTLPLKYLHYKIYIINNLSKIQMELIYHNPLEIYFQSFYSLPISPNSFIDKFILKMRNYQVHGLVKEKKEARQQYQKQKKLGKTVAYTDIQEQSKDILNVKLGNIPPKEEIAITIVYNKKLDLEMNKFWNLLIMSKVSPRYINDYKKPFILGNNVQQKYPNYKWHFQLHLSSFSQINFMRSSTHVLLQTEFNQEKTKASFILQESQTPATNFNFCYSYKQINKSISAIGYRNQQIYGGITFVPQFCSMEIEKAFNQKDEWEFTQGSNAQFIFFLDRSGSMSGSQIKKARQSLIFFLKSLPISSYFNIISFGTNYQIMFPKSVSLIEDNLTKAINQIKCMQANLGGTQILKPLCFIFKQVQTQHLLRHIFLLTDGCVSNTQQVILEVEKNNQMNRIHCIGIGSGCSQNLIKGCSQKGKGKFIFAQVQQNINEKIIYLLSKVLTPVVTDFEFIYNTQLIKTIVPNPKIIKFIQKNQTLELYFKYTRIPLQSDIFKLKYFSSLSNNYQQAIVNLAPIITSDIIPKFFSFEVIRILQNSLKRNEKICDSILSQEEPINNCEQWIVKQSIGSQILSGLTSFISVINGDQLIQQFQAKKQKQQQQRINIQNIKGIFSRIKQKQKKKSQRNLQYKGRLTCSSQGGSNQQLVFQQQQMMNKRNKIKQQSNLFQGGSNQQLDFQQLMMNKRNKIKQQSNLFQGGSNQQLDFQQLMMNKCKKIKQQSNLSQGGSNQQLDFQQQQMMNKRNKIKQQSNLFQGGSNQQLDFQQQQMMNKRNKIKQQSNLFQGGSNQQLDFQQQQMMNKRNKIKQQSNLFQGGSNQQLDFQQQQMMNKRNKIKQQSNLFQGGSNQQLDFQQQLMMNKCKKIKQQSNLSQGGSNQQLDFQQLMMNKFKKIKQQSNLSQGGSNQQLDFQQQQMMNKRNKIKQQQKVQNISNENKLMTIIQKQQFQGYWQINKQILQIIQKKEQSIYQTSKLMNCSIQLVVTVLVMKWINKWFSNRGQLKLILKKTNNWLNNQTFKEIQKIV